MYKIGFIGLGVMGNPMAERLLEEYNSLYIYSRTKAKADKLVEKGATWVPSVSELAKTCHVIITIVGLQKDVEDVYFGKSGLINNALPGTILVDMTTSSPSLAVEIANKAVEKEISVLDAPVSGGDVGAKNGTLSIMVGGNKEAYDLMLPIFNVLGKNIVYQGPAGTGQHAKTVNQIVIAGNMIGMVEAMVYAKHANLNVEAVLTSITKGAAASWQLDNNAPKVVAKDFQPGFFIKHFLKDIHIAQDEARKIALDLPGLDLVESLYNSLLENGYGNLGTQALVKYYTDNDM